MLGIPSHVYWARCEGGHTAVLDLHTGSWHMFSNVGARVWDAFALRGGVEGLAEEIAIPAGYDLRATRDAIDAYVLALSDMGLLASHARQRRRKWSRR
ncbi:hypothetical protein AB0O47_31935 [Streptomyces noursei]|uniref:hypothetical protein n=1 Tax=Streptomyces noursei TaxID=1971 RepID=UPI00344F8F3F